MQIPESFARTDVMSHSAIHELIHESWTDQDGSSRPRFASTMVVSGRSCGVPPRGDQAIRSFWLDPASLVLFQPAAPIGDPSDA